MIRFVDLTFTKEKYKLYKAVQTVEELSAQLSSAIAERQRAVLDHYTDQDDLVIASDDLLDQARDNQSDDQV